MIEEVGVDTLTQTGVILDYVPLHERERLVEINKSIKKYIMALLFGFLSKRYRRKVKPLDYIADYYGEKWAFYFAWLLHYTSWLILPSIGGLIIYLVLTGTWYFNQETMTY